MSAHSGDASILVVEDEEDIADLYATWLREKYSVHTAYTGEACLEQLGPDIDLVLLDRRMPGMSGDEILDHIETEYPNLPVAVVSAVQPGFGIMETGIEHYLVKPVEKSDLLTLVEDLLDRQTRPSNSRELARLKSKKTALEARFTSAELERRDEYAELESRIEELQNS